MKKLFLSLGKTRFNIMDLIFSSIATVLFLKIHVLIAIVGLIFMSTVYYFVNDLWQNQDESKDYE